MKSFNGKLYVQEDDTELAREPEEELPETEEPETLL